MKTEKKNKTDWMLIAYHIVIAILLLMTGISAGQGEWLLAVANASWTGASIVGLRSYYSAQNEIRRFINEQDKDNLKHIIPLFILGSTLTDKKNESAEREAKTSAEVNEETEMVHVGEGVGDE